MNERIKELLEQSKRLLGEIYPSMANTGAKWDMVVDQEKFAELIIKECATVADLNFDKGFCPVGGLIKQHFGVE